MAAFLDIRTKSYNRKLWFLNEEQEGVWFDQNYVENPHQLQLELLPLCSPSNSPSVSSFFALGPLYLVHITGRWMIFLNLIMLFPCMMFSNVSPSPTEEVSKLQSHDDVSPTYCLVTPPYLSPSCSMACSTGPPTKSWEELPHSLTLPWSSHLLFCFFLSYPPGKFYFHSLVSALKKMPSLKPFQILLHPLSRNLTHLFKDPLHLVCDHPMIILL